MQSTKIIERELTANWKGNSGRGKGHCGREDDSNDGSLHFDGSLTIDYRDEKIVVYIR